MEPKQKDPVFKLDARLFHEDTPWSEAYEILYQFHHAMWSRTWQELGISAKGASDDFRRMKSHVGFFLEGRAIAYAGYDLFDISRRSDEHHSYFKRFPEEIIPALHERGLKRLATMEYFTVDPEFRRLQGHAVGDILGAFSTQYLKSWPIDGLIALARKDRGIDKMCLSFGAAPLIDELVSYGVPTSIMVFERNQIRESDKLHVRSTVRAMLANLNKSVPAAMKKAA